MKQYKVELLPSAFNYIKAARVWYRQHNPELPKRFTSQLNLCTERIKAAPFAFAERYRDVHITNVGVFPYAILYLVIEYKVVIIAIHHNSISPDNWNRRLLLFNR